MLATGSRIGPYEIVSRAGAGGMGEVWKALDTRLGRSVAIKISDKKFSDRFEREARAIAALSHPHIAALYDVGPDYLVMEFIDGEPIKGPLPLEKALEYGKQILDALHAAHRAGIVHRDLKPANILVTKSGVKVLDFGLAKIEHAAASTAGNTITLTKAITQEGAIAGTLQYMAPEQLQGKGADCRADLFAFGCVLYEMLTGKRAFDGANAASVIAAILERPAPSIAGIAPPSLDRVLKRCLAKDPEERWQDALDIRAELEWVATGEHASGAAPQRWRKQWPLLAATVALAAGLASLAWIHFREEPPRLQALRASIPIPPNATLAYVTPAIAADGARIAFVARSEGKSQIWVRQLDSDAAYPLSGTDGATNLFWSPDGKSVGFTSGAMVNVIDISGGSAVTVANGLTGFLGAAWMRNGTIVYGTRSSLHSVPAGGGTDSDLALSGGPPGDVIRVGSALPDGRHFLYITTKSTNGYLLRAGSLESRESKVIEDITAAAYFSEGYLITLRNGMGVAQRFDTKTLAVAGPVFPLGQRFTFFAPSFSGLLLYLDSADAAQRLAVVDRHGAPVSEMDEQLRSIGRIDLARDGTRATFQALGDGKADLWLYDVGRKLRTRFTFDGNGSADGVWSPDGKTVIFSKSSQNHTEIYRKSADTSSPEHLLFQDSGPRYPMSLSPDGKFLIFQEGDSSLSVLPDPLGQPGKPYRLLARPGFNMREGQFSPDGKWVAYFSDESGRYEVYVTAFPGPGGKMQVSTNGGSFARWRRDGKELFYVDAADRVVAVPVTPAGSHLEFGRAEPLFGGLAPGSGFRYAVMPDGNHFLIVERAGTQSDVQLKIVQNWPALLKKSN